MTGRTVRILVSLGLACLLVAVCTYGLNLIWAAIGGGDMSIHGWIAMGLGVSGTVGLTWGLMALAFRSDRDGWDARVDSRLDSDRDGGDDRPDDPY